MTTQGSGTTLPECAYGGSFCGDTSCAVHGQPAPTRADPARQSGFYWVSESDGEPVVREWAAGRWQTERLAPVQVLGERLVPPGLSGSSMLSITELMWRLVLAVRELGANWEAKGEGFLIRIMATPPKKRKAASTRSRSV